jgi:hypothetical protein
LPPLSSRDAAQRFLKEKLLKTIYAAKHGCDKDKNSKKNDTKETWQN